MFPEKITIPLKFLDIPCRRYVSYLLSVGERHSDIIEMCSSILGVDIQINTLKSLWDWMQPIPKTKELKELTVNALKWLQRVQIKLIWIDEEILDGIIHIAIHPRLKEFVESLLLSGFIPEEIEKYTDVKKKIIGAYQLYIFDLSTLSQDKLLEFISNRNQLDLSLWQNRGQSAKEFILNHYQLAPIKTTSEMAGRRMIHLVNDRLFMLQNIMPNSEDAKMLSSYSMALKNASAVVGAGDEATSMLRDLLDTIKIDSDKEDIIALEELTKSKNINIDDEEEEGDTKLWGNNLKG